MLPSHFCIHHQLYYVWCVNHYHFGRPVSASPTGSWLGKFSTSFGGVFQLDLGLPTHTMPTTQLQHFCQHLTLYYNELDCLRDTIAEAEQEDKKSCRHFNSCASTAQNCNKSVSSFTLAHLSPMGRTVTRSFHKKPHCSSNKQSFSNENTNHSLQLPFFLLGYHRCLIAIVVVKDQGTVVFKDFWSFIFSSSKGNSLCQCGDAETSLGSAVIGIYIGTACIIFCVVFLLLGYRHRSVHLNIQPCSLCKTNHRVYLNNILLCWMCCSLFCSKGSQDSWSVPRTNAGPSDSPKDGANCSRVESEAQVTVLCKIQLHNTFLCLHEKTIFC